MDTRLRTALSIALLCGPASVAAAHGFGQRYDLPVPLWLYVIGAAVAVAGICNARARTKRNHI